MEIPIEKRFKILSQIHRASYFDWIEAVKEIYPGVDELELVLKFWEKVAEGTAKNYLKHLDLNKPLPRQIAKNFVWSSLCMGEDAELIEGKNQNECFARHNDCPWFHWHKRLGKLEFDQKGCDMWLNTLIRIINKELGTNIKDETLKSLPNGDGVCLRRFFVE